MVQSVGAPRKIFRGPVEHNVPYIKELPCAAANFKPGMIVQETAGKFALPAAADVDQVYVLNAPLHQDAPTYTYALDDTGYAYLPESGLHFLARLVAATYASNAPLTTDGTGALRLAAAGEPVIAYVYNHYGKDTVVPVGGGLADVRFR
jgi:hypothetical protein